MDYDDRRSVPPPPKSLGEWLGGLIVGSIVLAGCIVSMLLLMLITGALVAQWNGESSTLLMLSVGSVASLLPAIVLNGFSTWLRQQWNKKARFRDTFFPVILIGNTVLVLCLILFLPGKASRALNKHGNWMFDERVASFLEISKEHVVLRTGRTLVKRMAYLLEVESHRARIARTHNAKRAKYPDQKVKVKAPHHFPDAGRRPEPPHSSRILPPIRPLAPPLRPPSLQKRSHLRFRRHGSVPEVGLQVGTIPVRYLWDTGASFLTLTQKMARRLGVLPRHGAPTLTVHTANGRVRTRVGLLHSLTIGGFRLTHVAFVLCDACADTNQRVMGLLGSNVQRRFRFSVDHSKGHIELQPQPKHQWRNQALDIRPFLKPTQMKGRTLNLYVRRVFRLSATITNRAPVGVRRLLYQVSYLRGQRIVGRKKLHVLPLRAGQRRRIQFMDKKAPKFQRYRMELIEGEWRQER